MGDQPAPPLPPLGHPDTLKLLTDAANELVSWYPKNGVHLFFHDDGRTVTREFRRFARLGLIHRCQGPAGRKGGTVELTAAGILHLENEGVHA
jgi:hypothetical protein